MDSFISGSGFFILIETMQKNYKPCLFQKSGQPVRDSIEWGIYVKSIPFKLFPEIKELASRSWLDEDGDDEYYPSQPVFKAYEMDCQFVFIGVHGTANEQIKSFLTYLTTNGSFSLYDTYTQIGRKEVRYVSYSEDVFYRRDHENDIVVFSVKLKVNDPLTDITLKK